MQFEDLKLSGEYTVQLQASVGAGTSERYSCRFVGRLSRRVLIFTFPKIAGKFATFQAGQKFIARIMVPNGMGIFACSLVSESKKPFPLLYVSYPESIKFKSIRGSTRTNVSLPVEVCNMSELNPTYVKGLVADISTTGVRLELNSVIGELGDTLVMNASVAVAGLTQSLSIKALIRSRIERSIQEEGPVVYGVEFFEHDEDTLLVLYAYVFYQSFQDLGPCE